MKADTNREAERLAELKNVENPNEFIQMLRAWTAKDTGLAENVLFPLEKFSSVGVIEGFIGTWLVINAKLPLTTNAQVTEQINSLIDLLQEQQNYLQSNENELDTQLLRYVRSATGKIIGRDYWSG